MIGAHTRNVRRSSGIGNCRATRALGAGDGPADGRPVWGAHGWYARGVGGPTSIVRIEYVGNNPEKEGKRRQRWSFVVPFEMGEARRAAGMPAAPKRRIGGAAIVSQAEERASRATRLRDESH